jgi:hypothetical protein
MEDMFSPLWSSIFYPDGINDREKHQLMIRNMIEFIRELWRKHFPGIPHPTIRPCPSCGDSMAFRQSPYWHFGCTHCGYIERATQ